MSELLTGAYIVLVVWFALQEEILPRLLAYSRVRMCTAAAIIWLVISSRAPRLSSWSLRWATR